MCLTPLCRWAGCGALSGLRSAVLSRWGPAASVLPLVLFLVALLCDVGLWLMIWVLLGSTVLGNLWEEAKGEAMVLSQVLE